MMEDTALFPGLKEQHPELAEVIDGLLADHRKIDPLLEEGDRAFAELATQVRPAVRVVGSLGGLLHSHLETEEKHIVPFIREAKEFPPPASEAEQEMYAQGFAWSSHGVAQDVLDKLYELLSPEVRAKLPDARAAFAKRCDAVWGTSVAGAARTSDPGSVRRPPRSLPAGAGGAAQDGVHGVDLTAVHLEHVHVGVAHEHRHADADAGLGIGEEDAGVHGRRSRRLSGGAARSAVGAVERCRSRSRGGGSC